MLTYWPCLLSCSKLHILEETTLNALLGPLIGRLVVPLEKAMQIQCCVLNASLELLQEVSQDVTLFSLAQQGEWLLLVVKARHISSHMVSMH